jgi:hypothetical protein
MVSTQFVFCYLDESQFSPSRQSPTSPSDHSAKGKFARRIQQVNFIFVIWKKNVLSLSDTFFVIGYST